MFYRVRLGLVPDGHPKNNLWRLLALDFFYKLAALSSNQEGQSTEGISATVFLAMYKRDAYGVARFPGAVWSLRDTAAAGASALSWLPSCDAAI